MVVVVVLNDVFFALFHGWTEIAVIVKIHHIETIKPNDQSKLTMCDAMQAKHIIIIN